MTTLNKFNSFVEAVAEKTHNLGSDTLKLVLTGTPPSSTDTVLTDITEIANGNGYTTGGTQAVQNYSAQVAGTYRLGLNDVTFTATGTMASFRYAVLYNASATNDELVAFTDYGSSITLTTGDTFSVNFDQTNGVLSIT